MLTLPLVISTAAVGPTAYCVSGGVSWLQGKPTSGDSVAQSTRGAVATTWLLAAALTVGAGEAWAGGCGSQAAATSPSAPAPALHRGPGLPMDAWPIRAPSCGSAMEPPPVEGSPACAGVAPAVPGCVALTADG